MSEKRDRELAAYLAAMDEAGRADCSPDFREGFRHALEMVAVYEAGETGDPLRAMQVQVSHHYAENRGDHASDVVQAHAYDPDERVAEMVARVMGFPLRSWQREDPTAFVILRVVTGTEPKGPRDDNPPF